MNLSSETKLAARLEKIRILFSFANAIIIILSSQKRDSLLNPSLVISAHHTCYNSIRHFKTCTIARSSLDENFYTSILLIKKIRLFGGKTFKYN
jgi:hypothetical protein